MTDWKLRFSLGLLALMASLAGALAVGESSALVVVYNSSDPASQSLAKYYASRRNIPAERLVGLNCPQMEEISREEYDTTIANPLRTIFLQKGWWKLEGGRIVDTKIRFAVLMRGMPLKVKSKGLDVLPRRDQPQPIASRDEASVDSEIAAIGLGEVSASGLVPNPFFRRFAPIVDSITDPGLLLVCRLDAPTDITVRAMIDDAISIEKTGLWGWAYVDSRSIKDGGYLEGDEWLTALATQMRSKGIPVLWDKAPETIPGGYPITDAALYFGWYADNIIGPFANPNFRFRPGAVAVHIHSFSAATLRSSESGWAGPLLERGAAATLGNVYEPYLTLTAHLDVFADRLMSGFTLAESGYMSMRALSWMNVVIGDPLYRPFAAWQPLAVAGKAQDDWQRYRQIVMAKEGNVLAAALDLTEAARKSGNSMYLESLAAAEADDGDFPQALMLVNRALEMKNNPLIRFRLVLEKIGLMRATGKISDLRTLLVKEKGLAPGQDQGQLLDTIYNQLFPPPPTPTPAATPTKPK